SHSQAPHHPAHVSRSLPPPRQLARLGEGPPRGRNPPGRRYRLREKPEDLHQGCLRRFRETSLATPLPRFHQRIPKMTELFTDDARKNHLQLLVEIFRQGAIPLSPVGVINWTSVQRDLGLELPASFKVFCDSFPTGVWGNYL